MVTTSQDLEDWIARVAIGDRAAFSALYDATSAKLFGVCLNVLRNRAEAEEVLQEAFVRVWSKAGSYAANGHSPMTWLITLTRNLAIDRLRARKAPTQDLDSVAELQDKGPSPEGAAIAKSEQARIGACMDELEDKHAQAVRQAYLVGDSYQELAEQFAIPLNTVRTWLRRSLLKLKECLSR